MRNLLPKKAVNISCVRSALITGAAKMASIASGVAAMTISLSKADFTFAGSRNDLICGVSRMDSIAAEASSPSAVPYSRFA